MNAARITHRQFYELGGLSNPALYRKQKGGAWCYFMKVTV